MAIFNPKQSWVANWNRVGLIKPGLYAIDVKPGLSLKHDDMYEEEDESESEY